MKTAVETHEFIAYHATTTYKSCIRCGRAKDDPIHEKEPDGSTGDGAANDAA